MHTTGYVIAGIIAALGALSSLVLGIIFRNNKKLVATLLAIWAVLPPIYFFFEFHYVRDYHPAELTRVKESQDQAARIWAGVAAALGFLLVDKEKK